MVLLLTDVFLLLTHLFLWIIVGTVIWFILKRVLSRQFLGLLVLLLFVAVVILAFIRGGIEDRGILEVIWRILSFPLTLPGIILIFLIAVLNATNPKDYKLTKLSYRLLIAAVVLLFLGSVPIVSYFLAQELEMEAIELISPIPVPQADARQVIVLLGRDSTRLQLRPRQEAPPADPPSVDRPIKYDQFDVISNLPIQLTEHGDRILYAAQIYQDESRRGTNPLIVVSAGQRVGRGKKDGENKEDISEARDIQTMLTQSFGIPASNILLEHEDGHTRNSAEKVKKLLTDQQIKYGDQLVLVTSGLNMNRAVLTFQQVFNESCIIARPTDFYTIPPKDRMRRVAQKRDLIEREILLTDLLPTADSFFLSSKAIEEYLHSAFYFLRGWIRFFPSTNGTCPDRTPNPTPTWTPTTPPPVVPPPPGPGRTW
jgi:uncharacterized SAM-binding protein YcdF (DUF218 family)